MSNEYYTPSGTPGFRAKINSQPLRTEYALLEAAFDKLPTLAGNGGRVVVINAGGTEMDVTSAIAISGSNVTLAGALAMAGALTGVTSLTASGAITAASFVGNLTGNVAGNVTGNVSGSAGSATGNAATATALQNARTINGTSFDGTANITVAAAAGTLTGSTLAAGVTASSLTSLGTLTSLTMAGAISGVTDLTTTGNTTLGNASTDTLNVGNGGIIKDASGNVGIAGAPSGAYRLEVNGAFGSANVRVFGTAVPNAGINNPASNDLGLASGGVVNAVLTTDGRLYGIALHNNAGAVTGTTNQYIASGTYTPSFSNNVNLTSPAGALKWIRLGNVVHVAGEFTYSITAGTVNTSTQISLPIASNFTATGDLGGGGSEVTSGAAMPPMGIYANPTSDNADLVFQSILTGARRASIWFTYEIK